MPSGSTLQEEFHFASSQLDHVVIRQLIRLGIRWQSRRPARSRSASLLEPGHETGPPVECGRKITFHLDQEYRNIVTATIVIGLSLMTAHSLNRYLEIGIYFKM
jgi:hypothetical protein